MTDPTPDPLRAALQGLADAWSGCWCTVGSQGEQVQQRDCPSHGSEDCRHMAEGVVDHLRALLAAHPEPEREPGQPAGKCEGLDDAGPIPSCSSPRHQAPPVAHQDTEREGWLYGNGKTHRQADGTVRCPANGGIAAEVDEDGPWCSACGGDVEPPAPPVPETDEAAALAEVIAGIDGGRLADASARAHDACLRAARAVLDAGYRKQADR